MDVLIPDRSTATAREVATSLKDGGHRVHSCVLDDAALPCAALVGHPCPLDTAPIDVVVDVPNPHGRSEAFGDGALCAVRRRIPLVLAGDADGHRLEPWAAARAGKDVRATVAAVLGRPLPGHTAAASKALLHELRGEGTDSDKASVEVFRRPGRLFVEVWADSSVSRTQAEHLATHVAQAVRAYDRWAPKLDVTVRSRVALGAAAEEAPAGAEEALAGAEEALVGAEEALAAR